MSDENIGLIIKDDLDSIRETTPSSLDNLSREEQLWEKRTENLLRDWVKNMEYSIIHHRQKALTNRSLYRAFGIPSMLIPLVLSGFTGIVPIDDLGISLCLMTSGVLSGISNFMNFGKQMAVHFEFEAHYTTLCTDIEVCLSKPKKNRIAADVYIENIRSRYNNLNQNAPP